SPFCVCCFTDRSNSSRPISAKQDNCYAFIGRRREDYGSRQQESIQFPKGEGEASRKRGCGKLFRSVKCSRGSNGEAKAAPMNKRRAPFTDIICAETTSATFA